MLRDSGLLGKIAIVAIGSGWASAAASLVEDMGVDPVRCNLRMLADPKRLAYRHFKLHRGALRTFTWRRWDNFKGFLAFPYEMCCRRRLPGVNAGDPWQQGATFVVAGGGGKMLYGCREESPGWPRIEAADLISAARTAILLDESGSASTR